MRNELRPGVNMQGTRAQSLDQPASAREQYGATPAAESRRIVLRRGLGTVSVRVEGKLRIVTFWPGVYWNVNLRSVHDAFFGPPDPRGEVRFITMDGALFVSDDERPALCRGEWPETPA